MASFLNAGFLFLSPLWLPCQVDLFTLDALQMRKVRIKSAKFIHMQLVKSGKLPEGTVFNEAEVDQGGIVDGEEYYGGFTYSSSVAKQYAARCTPHAYADAAHMEGKGAFSYGTFFEYGIHDQNNSLCSIVKGHTVGTECHDEWLRVFGAAADVPGVDVSGRSVSADMEKSLGNAHDETMKHSSKFYDERHVKKNMIPNLGPKEKATGPGKYSRALRAPSVAHVEAIKATYGPNQKKYLDKFKDEELYTAYTTRMGLSDTSQGAESAMHAALANAARKSEPMTMLMKIAESEAKKFNAKKVAHSSPPCGILRLLCLAHAPSADHSIASLLPRRVVQAEALAWAGPVPPRVEKHLAELMTQAARYKSINAVPGSPGVFDVGSLSNASVKRRVKMSMIAFTPPECCAYAVTKGLPCYHGAAVIMQQYGAANMYKFVDKQHHTAAWKAVYEGATYEVPAQHVVDGIMLAAKKLVLSGDYLHQPKAIPPRRGRPVTDAGTRKQAWYEHGAAKTTRVYLCSLCKCAGHTRDKCELRQLFDDEDDV